MGTFMRRGSQPNKPKNGDGYWHIRTRNSASLHLKKWGDTLGDLRALPLARALRARSLRELFRPGAARTPCKEA